MKTIAVLLILGGLAGGLSPVDARGGHHGGFGGHHHGMAGGPGGGTHGSAFASDQHHANDEYVNAAEQEEDKLLDSKIKSICRGC